MKGKIKKMFGKKFSRILSGFLAFSILLSNLSPVAYAMGSGDDLLMQYRLDDTSSMTVYDYTQGDSNLAVAGNGNTVYLKMTDTDNWSKMPTDYNFYDADGSVSAGINHVVNQYEEIEFSFTEEAELGNKYVEIENDYGTYRFCYTLIQGTIGGKGEGGEMDLGWRYSSPDGIFKVPENGTNQANPFAHNIPTGYSLEVRLGCVDPETGGFVPYENTVGVTMENNGGGNYTATFDGAVIKAAYPDDYEKGYFHVALVVRDSVGVIKATSGMDVPWGDIDNGGNEGDGGGVDLPAFNGPIEYAVLGSSGGQVWEEYTPGTTLEFNAPYAMLGFRFKAGGGIQISNKDVEFVSLGEAVEFSKHANEESGEYVIAYMQGIAGEYEYEFIICGQEKATVKVKAEGSFYGEQMPVVDNSDFDGRVNIILGSEQPYDRPYHGTTKGSWTGFKFFTSSGTFIPSGRVGLKNNVDGIDFSIDTSSNGESFVKLEARDDARVGYYVLTIVFEDFDFEYDIVLHVSPPYDGGDEGDVNEGGNTDNIGPGNQDTMNRHHIYSSLEDARNAGYNDTFNGNIKYVTGTSDGYTPSQQNRSELYVTKGSSFGLGFLVPPSGGGYQGAYPMDQISIEFGSEAIHCDISPSDVYDGSVFDVTVSEDARQGWHVVVFNINGQYQPVIFYVTGYEDATIFDGTIQWIDVTACADGQSNGSWQTIRNGDTITLDINSRFAFRIFDKDGNKLYDKDGSVNNTGLDSYSAYWCDENGVTYQTYGMNGMPERLTTFEYQMKNGSAVTFHVQTIDNSGINTKVYDENLGQFVYITELNMPQNGAVQLGYFDNSDNPIHIMDVVIEGWNDEMDPHWEISDDILTIYGHDEEGNPLDLDSYFLKVKVNGIYKSIVVNVISDAVEEEPVYNPFFSETMPEVLQDATITAFSITGPPNNMRVEPIYDFFQSSRGSMFGVQFYENGELVPNELIDVINHSWNLDVIIGNEYSYGYVDIYALDEAEIGFHWVEFNVNGKIATVVVYVNQGGMGPGPGGDYQPEYEDTFEGYTQIVPNVPGMGVPSDAVWLDYDIIARSTGIQMRSDQLVAIRFLDENNNIISADRVSLVSGYENIMEFAGIPEYKIVYFGDRYFIGEHYLTYKIDNEYYKTIKLVSQFAVVKDHNANETRVVFDNFHGRMNLDLDESYGTVFLEIRGDNTLDSYGSNPVIRTAGELCMEFYGNLDINFESDENGIAAIETFGPLYMWNHTGEENGRKLTTNDMSGNGAAGIFAHTAQSQLENMNLDIDGDIIYHDSSDEEYVHTWVNNSTILAGNIISNQVLEIESSLITAESIESKKDVHIRNSDIVLSAEDDEQVGLHAGTYLGINDSQVIIEGEALYNADFDRRTLVYVGDELYLEDSEDGLDALLKIKSDSQQVYGIAAGRITGLGGVLDIKMNGEASTAVYAFLRPDESHGIALHRGSVAIESKGYGIYSKSNIQLGNPDEGKLTGTVFSADAYALATDPTRGGRIILENEDIYLYGGASAIQATYNPTGTEDGYYDFGYNAGIVLKAGNDAENMLRARTYEETLGKKYVETAKPDASQQVTVKFNTQGGEHQMLDMQKVAGNEYGELPVPVKIGYIFDGWTLEASGENYVGGGHIVEAELEDGHYKDITLYAQWIEGDPDTTYIIDVDTKHYVVPEFSYTEYIRPFTTSSKIHIEGDNRIEWPAALVENEYNSDGLVFTGYGYLTFVTNDGSMAVYNKSSKGPVTVDIDGTLEIYGSINSDNGFIFDKGEVYVEVMYGNAVYAQRTMATAIGMTVNEGAVVQAVSNNGTAVNVRYANLTVEDGGVLYAVGTEYGVEAATATNATSNEGKVIVEKGGVFVAYGFRNAMNVLDYEIEKDRNFQMVAGYTPDFTKEVKEYNGQRFFAVSDEFEATEEELSGIIVNGEEFNVDSEYEGENFLYVPDTEFMGQTGQNVLYLDKDFRFDRLTDIEGAYAYIFSTEDIVITSMNPDYTTEVESSEWTENMYSVYGLGNVRICDIILNTPEASIRAEDLLVDSYAEVYAKDVTANGNFTSMVASVEINGNLDVEKDAILCGMQSEEVYDLYNIVWNGYNTSQIKGDLILRGVTFTAGNDIDVKGNVELANSSLYGVPYFEDGSIRLDVIQTVTVDEGSVLEGVELTANNVTNNGEIRLPYVNVKGTFDQINGTFEFADDEWFPFIRNLNIKGGTFKSESESYGLSTYTFNMTGGTVDIDGKQYGININFDGKMTVTGGTLDVESDNVAINIQSGATVTINSLLQKGAAVVRLHGVNKAVDSAGKFTVYGDILTAADHYDGLNIEVDKYNGEKYFYINSKTHYTVTYEKENGEFPVMTGVRFDDFAPNMPAPSKAGYEFAGWYLKDASGNISDTPYNFATPVKSDITLVAKWTPVAYDIVLVVDQCEHDGPQNTDRVEYAGGALEHGALYGALPTPEELGYVREGHIFIGWSTVAGDANNIVTPETIFTSTNNQDLYAIWDLEEYQVTLNANGGKFVMGDNVSDAFVLNVPYYDAVDNQNRPTPRRANYEFTGWYTDPETSTLYEADSPVSENMELYAGWTFANTVEDVEITVDTEGMFRVGDRIIITTPTSNATIRYLISTTPITEDMLSVDNDQLKVYRESIEIKKSMLSAENGDVIYIAAIAVKDEFHDSQWTLETLAITADRDNWGDILEEDRDGFTDALDVPEYMWVANVPETLAYTGSALKPEDFRVYDGKTLLVLGTDYTISYKNNTKVGQAEITIKGKGNYADSMIAGFEIVPMSIEDSDVFTTDVVGYIKTFTNKEQAVSPKLLKDGKALKQKTDYVISYRVENEFGEFVELTGVKAPKEPGSYEVVLTATGNYTGVVTMPYTITADKLASTLKVSVDARKDELNYSGSPIEPALSVKDGKNVLVEGVHYEVVYENNVEVGKAMATVVAIEGSGYAGAKSVTFDIKGTKLSSSMLKDFASKLTYAEFVAAGQQQPTAYMINKTTPMVEGVDYAVEYIYDAEVDGELTPSGSVKMVVTGMGGYTGTFSKSFTVGSKISTAKLTGFVSTIQLIDKAEDGNVYQPETVKLGTVEEGTDYVVRYTNNDKVGTATVEYIGRGEYYGTIKKTFKITAIKLDSKKITVEGLEEVFDFTGSEIEQSGYTFSFNGTELVEGADYEVSYKNNLKAGNKSAQITFTGINDYTGTYNFKYTINKISAEDIDMIMDSEVMYTKGGAVANPELMYNGVVLVEGTDYSVKYSNHTKLSTETTKAKAVVTFKGNYTGTKQAEFDVVKANIENVTVTVADVVYKNKANRFKSTPKLVDTNGKALASRTDFATTYVYTYEEDVVLENGVVRMAGEVVGSNDIVPAGAVIRVTVEGAGLYEGEVFATYRIISGSVSSASVTIEDQNYTGDPVMLDKNQITVKVSGVELDYDDYEIVEYTNNINKGSAKVTIRGVGNYGGTKTVTFKIRAKSAKTTIKFMANGGTGSVAAVAVMNQDVYLTSITNAKGKQTMTRKGYVFAGWNTEKDGSGFAYGDADIFLAEDRGDMRVIRLYAQWEEQV